MESKDEWKRLYGEQGEEATFVERKKIDGKQGCGKNIWRAKRKCKICGGEVKINGKQGGEERIVGE